MDLPHTRLCVHPFRVWRIPSVTSYIGSEFVAGLRGAGLKNERSPELFILGHLNALLTASITLHVQYDLRLMHLFEDDIVSTRDP